MTYSQSWNRKRRVTGRAFLSNIERKIATHCWICQKEFQKKTDRIWHHIEPLQKKEGVKRLLNHCYSINDIAIELSKCICICRSCHIFIHNIYKNKNKEDIKIFKDILFRLGIFNWKFYDQIKKEIIKCGS